MSALYAEFRHEAEELGKLPVVIPVPSGGVYLRSYRAAKWSSVYSHDTDEMIHTILTCVIYTHREIEDYEADTSQT